MMHGLQFHIIKRQITENLIGLETPRDDQNALFRPVPPQQNQRETGGMFTFSGQNDFWVEQFSDVVFILAEL